jgi:hypothetical protein
MDDEIEPSDGGKARRVWEATWDAMRKKAAPLGDAAAEKLGHKLGWIVATFEVDEVTTARKVKDEELDYLADVRRMAQVLAALLDKDHPAIGRLQSFYLSSWRSNTKLTLARSRNLDWLMARRQASS